MLLAGGIGITPLLSMAKSIVHDGGNAPRYLVQAARNSRVHAFADEIRELAAKHPNMQTRVLYSRPLHDDLATGRCDEAGIVTTELLRDWTPYDGADFYVSGPKAFMERVHAGLIELGVPESRIRLEFIGPKQAIEAPAEVA